MTATHPWNSQTPLHIAARRGDYRLVRELLAAGADPTVRNTLGMTPAEVARAFGPFMDFESLLEGRARSAPRNRRDDPFI